jgi:hypothetical protein
LRKHIAEDVCAVMAGPGIAHNGFSVLTEAEGYKSPEHFKGHELMAAFLR